MGAIALLKQNAQTKECSNWQTELKVLYLTLTMYDYGLGNKVGHRLPILY